MKIIKLKDANIILTWLSCWVETKHSAQQMCKGPLMSRLQ